MLTAADIARMQADVATLIGDNTASIVIRRDSGGSSTELAAQTVRIERTRSRARQLNSIKSEEGRTQIVVVGDTTLDIQKDDRFTYDGNLYRVSFVRPNTQINVQAEAELIE